ncbi:prolyl oligopeptidase family serine peptidase [Mycolicibacterium moriokaense]|uniref:Prolyl oligopeptidase n=1 Tax=Mycolicibacterium moriokaense TaxID=39691 RepID=A0A318HD40_9MYCO|nr:prolyl oligopeptidase family serine peptidase [Mycolicibacterium moriokaense]PXX06319.1 prolyl oligopeptidase [Mycolicibacterium moriokaense]
MTLNEAQRPAVADTVVGDDPYLWLEAVDDEEVLEWVQRHNGPTLARLSGDRFEQMRAEALDVFDADTRIPGVTRRGDYLYNFWRDAGHPRGIWRRTTLAEYRKDAPEWDVVIDVDALAAAEDENWVWGGAGINAPGYTRALVFLSRGGGDATVVREFDMTTREFVADGFNLPEGKHVIDFEDDDTMLVGTDFGEGSLTESGYPRVIKRWRRATVLGDAEVVFSGAASDVSVSMGCSAYPGFERTFIYRGTDFYNKETFELRDGELILIDIPTDASMAVHREWAMIVLLSDWARGDTTYEAGTVLVTDYEQLVAGTAELHTVFEPGGDEYFAAGIFTGDRFLSIKLRDVATVVEVLTPGRWQAEPLQGAPANTTTVIAGVDEFGDEIFLHSAGFDTPPLLLHGPSAGPVRQIKSAPALFDADDLIVSQRFTASADGTRVPYFLVAHRDSTGPGPTLLQGYGAFRAAQLPGYLGAFGRLWLARGGNYAMANIRGGGEFGPAWHEQVLRENRHKVAEDFAAVARDLVAQGVTTAPQLGAEGGSAGGLLMGVMLTQYPELFGALVCRSPLLDMRRFNLLLAGASWMTEFGNPDEPADWEYIKQYSPYHNISAERKYPPVLITTSTRDDRVHPGHARKMAAALEAAGHPVLYYENTEGGHSGVANNAQAAFATAVTHEFLLQTLS